MLNKVFIFMFIIGIGYSLITSRVEELTYTLMNSPRSGLVLVFEMSTLLIFWSGILEIFKNSGLLEKITNKMKIVISKLFDMKKEEKALDYICVNLVANLFGLGAAAMPFGLKAMEEMNNINDKKEEASKDMITFLILNVAMISFMPTSVISLRQAYNSERATSIIPYVFFVSFLTMTFAILINKGFKKYAK